MGFFSNKKKTHSSGYAKTQVDLTPEQRALIAAGVPGIIDATKNPPAPYLGDVTADLTGDQQRAIGTIKGAADRADSLASAGADASKFLLNAYDVNNNPYLAGAVRASLSDLNRNFMNNVLPEIRGSALQHGQAGSSREGIAQGLALEGLARESSNLTQRMYSDAYNSGLQAAVGSLQQLSPTVRAQTAGGEAAFRADEPGRQLAQTDLDRQKQIFEYLGLAPYLYKRDALAIAAGLPGAGSTVRTRSTGSTSGGLLGGLVGAAGGFLGGRGG